MKITFRNIIAMLLAALFSVALPACALAADTAVAPDTTITATPDPITGLVQSAAAQYPWVVAIFAAMGLLRTVAKPVMSWLHARAAATVDTADDAKLERVEASWWYRALAWLLNYTASIPFGPQVRK